MRQTGIKASWRNIDRGSRCYGYKSDCRMRPDEWQSFSGFCGHGEVPENTHWDPGNMDFSLLNVNEGGSDTMLPMMLGDGYRSRPEKKEDVRLLQLHLNKLGHGLVVDGAYGPATKAAVASSLGGDGTRVEAEEWMSLMEKTAVVSEELLRRGDTVKLR